MCGRFAIGETDGADWRDWLLDEPGIDRPPIDWPPPAWPSARWNVAPTDPVGIVVHDARVDGRAPGAPVVAPGPAPDIAPGAPAARRVPAVARWGLVPHWWRKPLAEFKATTFNARSEEAASKPMFRDAWATRRCLIPAIGYYEWTGPKGAKTPWFVTMRRNTPGLLFAGLWASARIGEDRLISCTILTTAAGAATGHLHPRSPVVLAEEDADGWLDGSADPASLMRPIPDERVELWEVDRAVGQVRNDGPSLIERVGLAL